MDQVSQLDSLLDAFEQELENLQNLFHTGLESPVNESSHQLKELHNAIGTDNLNRAKAYKLELEIARLKNIVEHFVEPDVVVMQNKIQLFRSLASQAFKDLQAQRDAARGERDAEREESQRLSARVQMLEIKKFNVACKKNGRRVFPWLLVSALVAGLGAYAAKRCRC